MTLFAEERISMFTRRPSRRSMVRNADCMQVQLRASLKIREIERLLFVLLLNAVVRDVAAGSQREICGVIQTYRTWTCKKQLLWDKVYLYWFIIHHTVILDNKIFHISNILRDCLSQTNVWCTVFCMGARAWVNLPHLPHRNLRFSIGPVWTQCNRYY